MEVNNAMNYLCEINRPDCKVCHEQCNLRFNYISPYGRLCDICSDVVKLIKSKEKMFECIHCALLFPKVNMWSICVKCSKFHKSKDDIEDMNTIKKFYNNRLIKALNYTFLNIDIDGYVSLMTRLCKSVVKEGNKNVPGQSKDDELFSVVKKKEI